MNKPYIILDFETTGLSADYDRVIEVGAIKVEGNKIVDVFQEFVHPGTRIPTVITQITGITNDMVKDADRADVVFPKLKEFVGDNVIIAHNASFDARFFRAEMERVGIDATNEFLCTLLLSRRIYQNLSSHKLGSICDHLGFVNKAAHRAYEDAEVTQKVFADICEKVMRLSGKNSLDADYMIKLSRVPKKKLSDWLRSS